MKSGKCAYSEKISSLTSVHITSRKRRNNLEGKQATITMYG